MDSWERFSETRLPDKENFYSKLNDEHITDEEYAQAVWEIFECKTLGDYHDLYVKTDVALLADVFENFRNLCQEQYGLDLAHYLTSPGLSWDALLKKTRLELDFLTDIDMHLFVERGMRGGISMVSKTCAKVNNPLVPEYDPSKPKKIHHVSRRKQPLRMGNEQAPPEKRFQMETCYVHRGRDPEEKRKAKNGWILEVDLEYPAELHEEHNSYPLAPEKKVVKKERMSEYQKRLMEDLELKPPDSKKLLLTLEDKRNYVVHLQKLAVLSEAGNETEARAQGVGVRTRMLDGAVHPDEHRIQEKSEERL